MSSVAGKKSKIHAKLTLALLHSILPLSQPLFLAAALTSTSMGRNPLQAAAIEGNTELTRILLDAGAEVNAHRTHGGQFWHYDLQNHP